MQLRIYSRTSVIGTVLGPPWSVPFSEVSLLVKNARLNKGNTKSMFSIEYGVYCDISVYQTVMLSSLYIHTFNFLTMS